MINRPMLNRRKPNRYIVGRGGHRGVAGVVEARGLVAGRRAIVGDKVPIGPTPIKRTLVTHMIVGHTPISLRRLNPPPIKPTAD